MRVAVIGAGPAGICAARKLSAVPGLLLVIYEQTSNIGGTWVYRDETGIDEYGLPIHSSMYRNLRTSSPKETMEFFHFPLKHEKSFISRNDVLQYLTDFVDYYGLRKYIKFFHHVLKVTNEPTNETWEVTAQNLHTNEIEVCYFDAVIVCNGHNSHPRYPELAGMDKYTKMQMHSHEYRDPEIFKGKVVTVVGSGLSGIDILFEILTSAKQVFFSHHNPKLMKYAFPKNVIQKPDISYLTENEIIFKDGTNETVDYILYCTGYEYRFPFLSKECGITVEDNFVQPLYKHLININHPTMWFIGIPWQSLVFPMFDLQVRCLMNVLLKKIDLPSREEMLLDLQSDLEKRKQYGEEPKYFHRLGNFMDDYLRDLANTFTAEPIPQVVTRIHNFSKNRISETLRDYKQDAYEIIDSVNYVLHKNKFK